jgi:hypothetical protein
MVIDQKIINKNEYQLNYYFFSNRLDIENVIFYHILLFGMYR